MMVDRGTTVLLEPDLYPKHAEVAERLRRLPGWTECSVAIPAAIGHEDPHDSDKSTGILPHQAIAIEKIKRNREQERT